MTSNRDYPVENRSVGQLTDVDKRQRLVDVIVLPYEQEGEVFHRGELWREKFTRGAFDGIENHAGRVRVNREHVKGATVGKVVSFDPKHTDGLLGRIKVVNSAEGDQVLALAEEDMVSISAGFVARPSDVLVDRRSKLRTVMRAFLDHVSFVEDPAYEGAKVLAVREGYQAQASDAGPLVTPNLDEFLNDELFRWADSRRG